MTERYRKTDGDSVDFVWDAAKAEANKRKHGIDFDIASEVFFDPGRIENLDEAHSQDEPRWQTTGNTRAGMLFVVSTERDFDIIRIIMARKATRNERREYYQANA